MNKYQIIGLILFLILVGLANIPEEEKHGAGYYFPKPDPEMGTSLGWDFKNEQYIYAEESLNLPAKAYHTKPSTVISHESSEDYRVTIYRTSEIREMEDIDNILRKELNKVKHHHTNNNPDYSEEDVEDLRDYLGY